MFYCYYATIIIVNKRFSWTFDLVEIFPKVRTSEDVMFRSKGHVSSHKIAQVKVTRSTYCCLLICAIGVYNLRTKWHKKNPIWCRSLVVRSKRKIYRDTVLRSKIKGQRHQVLEITRGSIKMSRIWWTDGFTVFRLGDNVVSHIKHLHSQTSRSKSQGGRIMVRHEIVRPYNFRTKLLLDFKPGIMEDMKCNKQWTFYSIRSKDNLSRAWPYIDNEKL